MPTAPLNNDGRQKPSATGNVPGPIYAIQCASDLAGRYRFEWHPEAKTVYLIRLWVFPLMGDPIAMNVLDHGAAFNAALVWCRGYREGSGHLRVGSEPSEAAIQSAEEKTS